MGTTQSCGGRRGCSRQWGQLEQKPTKKKSKDLLPSCFKPSSAPWPNQHLGPIPWSPDDVSSPPFWCFWKTRPLFPHPQTGPSSSLSLPHASFSVPQGIPNPIIMVLGCWGLIAENAPEVHKDTVVEQEPRGITWVEAYASWHCRLQGGLQRECRVCFT